LVDGRHDNGQRKVDDDLRCAVWQMIQDSPRTYGYPRPTWTLELLRLVIAEVLNVILSVGHLWRVLKRLGIRWGRPRPVVRCPWKSADRKRRIAELKSLRRTLPANEALLYADEVDIHLNPKIGPDWMLPGAQKLVITPGQNMKRYLAGAFDPIQNRLVYVEGDRKVSWLFLNLLRALLDAYRCARRIHLILDNYIIHKSAIVRAAMRGMPKIVLHFLPPYCPQENRIEREWLDLHANVTRNHRCRSIDELMQEVHAYLQDRYWSFRGVCVA
jgi:transposase